MSNGQGLGPAPEPAGQQVQPGPVHSIRARMDCAEKATTEIFRHLEWQERVVRDIAAELGWEVAVHPRDETQEEPATY